MINISSAIDDDLLLRMRNYIALYNYSKGKDDRMNNRRLIILAIEEFLNKHDHSLPAKTILTKGRRK